MAVELEYKYAADPKTLAEIAGAFGPWQTIRMQTTYYDTPSRSFSRARCTLRLRKENDVCVCTFKAPLPDGSREEYECEAATIEEGIAQIPQALALADGPLEVVCSASFTRLACRTGGAELALDQGILIGGGKELPLWEVEAEYKSGDPQDTLLFARTLAQTYGLRPEPKSKFARAMALAEGETQ